MAFPTNPKQFKSWSNSRYNDYAECPAKANYKHLLKLPEPKSAAMERGIFIAKQEEDYLAGKIRTVPGDIHKDLHPYFRAAKKAKGLIYEQNWGFDKNWNVVDYFDWDNCWLRVKVDMGWTLTATAMRFVDNKTGKFRERDNEKYVEQLGLYSAAGIARFPQLKKIESELCYTDLGIRYPFNKDTNAPEPMVMTAAQAVKVQKDWTKRVQPMFNDVKFLPRPGHYCSWCHYRKNNGGPCKY